MYVDEVTVIAVVVLCAGNEDISDDEAADTDDDVFHIPDAVFGSAGCHAASVAVNGELSHPYSNSRWEQGGIVGVASTAVSAIIIIIIIIYKAKLMVTLSCRNVTGAFYRVKQCHECQSIQQNVRHQSGNDA